MWANLRVLIKDDDFYHVRAHIHMNIIALTRY